jgi:hypothetical protein
MSMDRAKNPGLEAYRMVEKGNTLRYVDKEVDEGNFKTERHLDNLLELKKYYQIPDEFQTGPKR